MKRLLFVLLSFVMVFNSNLFSQQYPEVCPDLSLNIAARPTSILTQKGGLFKPASNAPGQYLRVLIVFAEFSGDNRTFSDWTYGHLPTYSNKIVNVVTATQYSSFSLSDYWKTMAFGNYDIIGDVYPNVVTLRSEDWYRTNNKWFQDSNKDVLDSINGKVDFKKYDNWGFNSSTNSFVFNPQNGDGYLDMMYIIYRNPGDYINPVTHNSWFTKTYGNFGGIAILGENFTFVTHDGTIIDGNYLWQKASGITIRKGAGIFLPSFTGMLAHELGHYLFGAGHTVTSGIMGGGTFSLSGWEKERLGYCAYTTAYQDSFNVTLQDFVTTGQVLKIPIPNSTNNYFLVENHQRLSKYDQIMQGGQLQGAFDTTTTLGKGIYVWLIKSGDYFPPTVDVKTANGNWNWIYDGAYYAGPGWGETGYLPKTKKSSVNRDGTGKSDRYPLHIYINNPVFGTPKWWAKWVELNDFTNQYELTRNVMGLETHAFNYNYTQLLTPWSSPSSYVDGVTNLAMQVFSQNGNNITIKTFNTYNSCLSLPPSKPQNVKATLLDRWTAQLTWEPNIEPDVITNGKYKIYRAEDGVDGMPSSWEQISIINAYSNGQPVTSFIDDQIGPSYYPSKVFYKISAVDNTQLESICSDYDWVSAKVPKIVSDDKIQNIEYSLKPNYPNPFNPSTVINYSVKDAGLVKIKIYDILGSEIAELVNEMEEAGYHSVDFNASNLPSGVYIYTLQVNGFSTSQKMLLLK